MFVSQDGHTLRCAVSKDCKAKAKVEKMDSAADSPKWQTFTANAHTCQLHVVLDGDVAPAAKRARTVAPRDSAPVGAAQSDHPAGGDDGDSVLSQLRSSRARSCSSHTTARLRR